MNFTKFSHSIGCRVIHVLFDLKTSLCQLAEVPESAIFYIQKVPAL